MNQWAFVAAAYAVTIVAVALLLILSWRSMRAAERQAEELRDRR
jgi:heme exporter protein CcmD